MEAQSRKKKRKTISLCFPRTKDSEKEKLHTPNLSEMWPDAILLISFSYWKTSEKNICCRVCLCSGRENGGIDSPSSENKFGCDVMPCGESCIARGEKGLDCLLNYVGEGWVTCIPFLLIIICFSLYVIWLVQILLCFFFTCNWNRP